MLIVDGYEPGSNLTIINVIYQYAKKDPETGKRTKDFAIIVYKDNDTGEKHATTIYEPEYTWYLVKEGRHPDPHFAEFDDVIPITCKYSEVTKSIAKETGNLALYNKNIQDGNWRLNKQFFLHPRSYGADIPIKNYLRIQFNETYKNPIIDLDVMFFDTEADIINSLNDNPVMGECPTVMISAIYPKTNTVYCFMVRNPKNPQIEKLENSIKENFEKIKAEVHEYIRKQLGKEYDKYASVATPELSIGFFDTEIEMYITFFDLINQLSPDLLIAWNGFGYDYAQITERIKVLGYNPADVVCDRRIKPKVFELFIDEKNKNDPQQRTDYADISVMYVWQDDMIIYASRRKGGKVIESFSLDYIGGTECNVHKFDYHEITTNIAKFPWLNYKLFWIYNILDVLVQVCIEIATQDIKFMFNNVIEMNTSFDKIWRQTNFLAAKGADFYIHHENVVMGNNTNRFNDKPSEKFPGAFVARPNLLSDKNKVKTPLGTISKYNNADDWDYKSLYPSLMREFNTSPSTLIGMIQIEDAPYHDPDYLRIAPGGTFVENLASYNYIEFCHRWLNMANVEEALEDFEEYFNTYRTPMYKGEGNLEFDRTRKVIAYHTDTINGNRMIASVERPIPDWIWQEVNKIRASIPIK